MTKSADAVNVEKAAGRGVGFEEVDAEAGSGSLVVKPAAVAERWLEKGVRSSERVAASAGEVVGFATAAFVLMQHR